MSELACYKTLEKQQRYELAEEIGRIKRFYSNKKVAEIEIVIRETNLLTGQKIYIVRDSDGCSECKETIIESLRVANQNLEEATVNGESIKIEIMLNIDNVKKDSKIYKLREISN